MEKMKKKLKKDGLTKKKKFRHVLVYAFFIFENYF